MVAEQSFEQKKTVCNAKFEDFGDTGTGVNNLSSKVAFGIANPDLPIHYATFMGATMMIKGSLLLSAPIVKRF